MTSDLELTSHSHFASQRDENRDGQDAGLRQAVALARDGSKGDRRLIVRRKNRPLQLNVPASAPLPLGEPMPLNPLPWLDWGERAFVLLTLSLTRWIGK